MNNTVYSPPSNDTHFLVSGGGKGITAANAIALAKAFQSSFTLIGRSGLIESEPDWAKDHADEPGLKSSALTHFQSQGKKPTPRELDKEVNSILSSREIGETLDAIRKAGSEAVYIQADITNLEQLQEALVEIVPRVNAILHGAGALADKYIEDKEESDFDLVYGVKVGGLKNILALIPPQQLNYLILFSSVAGFYGNAGQADYSLSNEILNKLAHHLKLSLPECRVLSIGWGPWDGGMVSPQLRRILTKKNVPLISMDEGTNALLDLLKSPDDTPQHVIGNPLPMPGKKLDPDLKQYRITRALSPESNPFLYDHVIGGKAVLPTVCAVAWFINSCKDLYPEYHFYKVSNYQVFKGIVFDSEASDEYGLELNEQEKSNQSVLIQGKISSELPDGKIRYHYQAQVELRKEIPDRPKLKDFDLTTENPLDGKTLYDSKVLFHGPMFQGIKQVLNISSEGLTTECKLPEIADKDMGQFPVKDFNPFLADIHLQSLLIWANAQQESIGLPLQIASGTQYQLAPFDEITYATMIVKTITPHKLVADVISHDQEGFIYSHVVDAEITLNEKLFDLFKENQLEPETI